MLCTFLEKNLTYEEKRDIMNKMKIDAFFHRFDKDNDMLISYTDFVKNLEPFNSNI